jgi:hypothetical protein
MNKQQELIQYQIDSLRYKQAEYYGYRDNQAKQDHFREADEYDVWQRASASPSTCWPRTSARPANEN